MKREKIMIVVGERLGEMRKRLNYNIPRMASALGLSQKGYYKNENGKTVPNITSLVRLAEDFEISLDWLVMNRGEMYYQEKEQEVPGEKEAGVAEEAKKLEEVMPEVRELVDCMADDPLLLHQVLAHFHEYKRKQKAEPPVDKEEMQE